MSSYEEVPKIGKKSLLLLLMGLVLMVPLLATFDLGEAMENLRKIGPVPVFLSFLSIHIGVLFYNLGWYILLDRRARFKDVFLIGWTSLFVNLLIPAGSASGEVARVYFIRKKADLPTGEALSTIVAHRVVMIVPFIVSIILGTSYLLSMIGPSERSLIAIMSSIILMSAFFYLIYKLSMDDSKLIKIVSFVERKLNKNYENIKSTIREYSQAFRNLMNNRRMLLLSLTCSFLNWLFDMLPIFIYFIAMGYWIDPLMGALIYSVSIILVLIPIGIPGNTGIREWTMTGLLSAIGLTKGEALALTLVSSTVTVFLNELMFGLIAYIILIKNLSKKG